MVNYLDEKAKDGYKTAIFFSDATAGSQNRSYTLVAAFLDFLRRNTSIKEIHHIFFEPGHSQNEGDSIHSSIERASRKVTVMFPEEWVGIIKMAQPNNPLNVRRLSHRDFRNYKALAATLFGTPQTHTNQKPNG